MSIFWQLFPSYWEQDHVWVLRDADLVLSLLRWHPEMWKFHDKIIALLQDDSSIWVTLREKLFRSYGSMKNWPLAPQDRENLTLIDKSHWAYKDMLTFRYFAQSNPSQFLENLKVNIQKLLDKYPLKSEEINKVSEMVSKVDEKNFASILSHLTNHAEKIAFCEWCISKGKCLPQILAYAKEEQNVRTDTKEKSFEYWDYNNLISLVETRMRISDKKTNESKAFSLSGWAWNALSQLSVIYEYIKWWGRVSSISGTSMGSLIAVLVAKAWNNHEQIKKFMDDIEMMGNQWVIPEKLNSSQKQREALELFEKFLETHGITEQTRFSDLDIPALVNAWRQYEWWEQEVVLWWSEKVLEAVRASMNVPTGNNNNGKLGSTPVHGVPMIDYAANERWNPTHWLEIAWEEQKNLVAIDVWYSSEKWGSAFVRRLFQRATFRDFYAKMRMKSAGGIVIDMPLQSSEWYNFPKGAMRRFFDIGKTAYEEHFTSPPAP